jgi:hypothetical protein
VPDAENDSKERLGRLVGSILIAEGLLIAILRFLALVYVVASQAYTADRFRTPLRSFIPWVVITTAASLALVWAGSFFRRAPDGAWSQIGLDARVDLIAALLLNVAALVWAVSGLIRSPSTPEASLTWVALVAMSFLVVVGLVRDMLRRPPAD